MHDERLLLEARLNRFVRDHLEPAIYQASAPLALTAWRVPGEPVPFADAARQNFTPIDIGAAWGEPWSTLWIHAVGKVPADWLDVAASKPEVVVDLGFTAGAGFQAEALAYRTDGSMIKAVSPFNNHLPVTPGEPVEFYLEAAANPDVGNTGFRPTPNGDPATAIETPLYVIKKLDLALKNVRRVGAARRHLDIVGTDARAADGLQSAGRDLVRAATSNRRH